MQRKTSPIKAILVGVLLIGAVALLINVLIGVRAAPTPDAFVNERTLTEAIETAGAQDRHVIAVATADWCAPCQHYKRDALADADVGAWIEANAVPVMVDVTDGPPPDAGMLNVGAIPATYLLRNGEVVATRVGAIPADDLLTWLKSEAPAN